MFTFIFLWEYCSILIEMSLKFCFQWSNKQWASVGLDYDLAQNRQQAIKWTNDGPAYWRIYATLECLEQQIDISVDACVAGWYMHAKTSG